MDYFKKIERSVTISADKRSTVDLQVDIWSQDLNVTKFILKLDTTDSTTIDLTNATVRVAMVYNQDGTDVKIEAAGIVEDVATQKIAYIMDNRLAGFEGTVAAGFYVTLNTGQKIDIQNVTFNMRKSLLDKDLEAATESYYQTFEDIVADVQSEGEKAKTNINAVLPTIQSQVSELDRQIKALPPIPDLYVAYANSADGSVDFSRAKPKENLWEQSKTIDGWFENDGTITNAYSATQHKIYPEYISVNPNDIYYLTIINPKLLVNTVNSNKYAFYDTNKALISWNWVTLNASKVEQIKITIPDNARYMRVGVVQGVDSYDSSVKIKLEKSDTPTTYLPSPTDNYRDSFMKYIGYGVKNSDTPTDYKWQINPEWQRAQLDYEKAVVIQDKLVNLIVNGDFSNGLSSWYLDVFGEIENYQNKLKFSTDSTQENHAFRTHFSESLKKNHKYYLKFDLDMSDGYLNTADFYFEKNGGYFDKVIQIGNNRSFLIDLTVDADMLHFGTRGTSVGYILLDNVKLYNLTFIFGVGNEPTLDEFERLMSINVNSPTIYSQSILKAKLNSNPINSILTTLSGENPSTALGGEWSQLGTETKFDNTIYYWKRTN